MQNIQLPLNVPVPTPRPSRGLDVDREFLDRLEIENRRRMQAADLASMRARSPIELAEAAAARERAAINFGESDASRESRISLASSRARTEAEYRLSEAQKERARSLLETVATQQLELTMIGRTRGEVVALQAAYGLTAQLRADAARNNIAVDERELQMIRDKAAELGRIADLSARASLRNDVLFERAQMQRSAEDQAVGARLRGAGLSVDFGTQEAQIIRENIRMGELRAGVRGFFSDFQDGLLRGDKFGATLANSISRALSNLATRYTDRAFDSFTNSLIGSPLGRSMSSIDDVLLRRIDGSPSIYGNVANSPLYGGAYAGGGISAFTSSAVDRAMGLLGQTETGSSASINGFLRQGGVDIDAARTAWCAGFVNSALQQVGVDGTGSLVANSFQTWGRSVDPTQALRGDVLLQSRGLGRNALGGHVGFATGASRMMDGQLQLQMLSGNQNDSVMTSWINANQLQVRRATEAATSLGRLASSSGIATQNLGILGNGVGQLGNSLSQIGNIAATGGAGTGGGLWSSILGGFGRMFGGISPTSSLWSANTTLGSFLIRGYSSGGPTGGSDPGRVAGLVHEKEYVFDAATTALIGVHNLDALRHMARFGGKTGFDDGGYVMPNHVWRQAAASVAASERMSAPAPAPRVSVNIINNAGVSVETRETTDEYGGQQIEFVLSEQVGQALTKRGGAAADALEKQFGVRRKGPRR
ncbi:hypothetical protein [Rhizobium sp. CSW-27]|uniref:hypothetical protein n=1 Tax=Rhizobium sp. CSW-27 TaxID=2839985 RepID=UPI002078ADA8|nr:hypothetical protein [Rhizobium sp. CSW-27]